MKKTAAVLVVLVCLWMVASVSLAQKCESFETPIVEIEVGRETKGGPIVYRYPNKDKVSTPSICRDRNFELKVTFLDDSVKELKLKDFQSTFTKGKRWRKDTGDNFTLEVTVTPDNPEIKGLKLDTGWSPPGLVKVRMILFTAEMKLADGTVVSFDPPWGERP
jgi:hypothetical protein